MIDGGVLEGSGTVSAVVTIGSGGAVGPGNSPGLLQVYGDAVFLGGATLAFELGGLRPGSGYDRLDVADDTATGVVEGTVSLADGAIFDIDYYGAFTAGLGDSFDVLVADAFAPFDLSAMIFDFSGAVLGTGLLWDYSLVDFGGGREALRLTVVAEQVAAVPEPGPTLVFIIGVFGLAMMRRRMATA
jgi:hypothetical protein